MTHPKLLRTLIVPAVGCLAPAWIAAAQQEPAPAAAPAAPQQQTNPSAEAPAATPAPAAAAADANADHLLAPQAFTSETAGVTFRPPSGWKQTNNAGDDAIAVYTNDQKWVLRVTRAALDHPLPLVAVPAPAPAVNAAPQPGMMDVVVDNFKKTAPDTEILRNEVINVGPHFVGVVVARYTLNGQQWLRQQAMVQASDDAMLKVPLGEQGARLYYVFNLMTPAGTDADARLAADTFSAVIDTVQPIDRAKIKADQDARLYRTRALFVDWNRARFEQIIAPKQYFRILKDGKDIGYSFREEMLDHPNLVGISAPGAIAYERTHLDEADEKGRLRRTDAGLFKYASFDRDHERWTRTVVLQALTPQGKPYETYATEFGESLRKIRLTFAKESEGGARDPRDPKGPATKPVEGHTLDIITAGKDQNGEPVHRDLPGWYLPQSTWYFLPRLVIDGKKYPGPRTYMFAVYNSERREVMNLYVDKSAEQDFTFNGRRIHAISVTERLGLGGNPVVHYVTPEGKYVGCEDKAQHLVTVASDEKEVLQIWPKANLTRPEPIQPPNKIPAAAGAPTVADPAPQPDASPARQLPPTLR